MLIVMLKIRAYPRMPLSPPPSPPLMGMDHNAQQHFDPCAADVNSENSVLLSIDCIPAYLDDVLKALSVHTDARTSFIT